MYRAAGAGCCSLAKHLLAVCLISGGLTACTVNGLNGADQTAVAVANTATAGARAPTSPPTRTVIPDPTTAFSSPTVTVRASGTPQASAPPDAAGMTPTVGVSGTPIPSPTAIGRLFADPDQHFSFTIPAGWERQQTQTPDIIVQFASDRLRGNMNVGREKAVGVALDQYVQATMANIKQAYPEIEFGAGGAQPVTIGAKDARRYDFSGTIAQTQVRVTQIAAISDGFAYLITFTSAPAVSEVFAAQMTSIVQSFAFEPPAP